MRKDDYRNKGYIYGIGAALIATVAMLRLQRKNDEQEPDNVELAGVLVQVKTENKVCKGGLARTEIDVKQVFPYVRRTPILSCGPSDGCPFVIDPDWIVLLGSHLILVVHLWGWILCFDLVPLTRFP